MTRTHLLCAICAICGLTPVAVADPVLLFDAAEYGKYGEVLYDPLFPENQVAAVRMMIDNTANPEDLTGVRFQVVAHEGRIENVRGYSWSNTDNPWHGLPGKSDEMIAPDGKLYWQGLLYISATKEYAPAWGVDPTPEAPDSGDEYELWDVVPAGMTWDCPAFVRGVGGTTVDLFSTAEGILATDTFTTTLYDPDPLPQTAIPEPATMALLGAGAVGLLRRRMSKRRHT